MNFDSVIVRTSLHASAAFDFAITVSMTLDREDLL